MLENACSCARPSRARRWFAGVRSAPSYPRFRRRPTPGHGRRSPTPQRRTGNFPAMHPASALVDRPAAAAPALGGASACRAALLALAGRRWRSVPPRPWRRAAKRPLRPTTARRRPPTQPIPDRKRRWRAGSRAPISPAEPIAGRCRAAPSPSAWASTRHPDPGNIASTRLDNTGPLVQTLPSLSFGVRSVDAPSGGWLKQLAGGESATGVHASHRHRMEAGRAAAPVPSRRPGRSADAATTR